MLSSKILRALVDNAWDDPRAITLRQQLRVFETQAHEVIAGGTYSSTSANGRHVALTGSGPGQATQLELAEAWRYLVDTYDRSANDLSIQYSDGIDPDSEQLIKNQMMANLREVLGHTSNFIYLSK